jgi:acetyl-CoA C-acetyltransferase
MPPRSRLERLARHMTGGDTRSSAAGGGVVGGWGGRKKAGASRARSRRGGGGGGAAPRPMGDDTVPVIIGVSRLTPRGSESGWAETGGVPSSPLDLMTATALQAAEDTGLPDAEALLREEVTAVGCAGMYAALGSIYPNLPRSLANRLGVGAGAVCHQRGEGGDGAQALTNLMASRIASGALRGGVVLLSRGIAVDSQRKWSQAHPGEAQDLLAAWSDDPGVGEPERSGVPPHAHFASAEERRHGLDAPIHVYPLIETALRAKYGESFDEHHGKVSQLMAGFSEVAASPAERPYAWMPTARTADQIAMSGAAGGGGGGGGGGNRWVGYPYTKYMCANDSVDGAASWLLCSAATAARLGVRKENWVYILGGAQAHEGGDERWFVSNRADITALPAMETTLTHTLQAADIESADIDLFDIYSCFPCVVQIACDHLGVPHDGSDPRGLTITGGLPYAGQMSSTQCIPAMVEQIRQRRNTGYSEAVGMVTGNGGYATKHSAGIYSSHPHENQSMMDFFFDADEGEEGEEAKSTLQATIDSSQVDGHIDMIEVESHPDPAGEVATIETFTIAHDRNNSPTHAVVFCRLRSSNRRCIAWVRSGQISAAASAGASRGNMDDGGGGGDDDVMDVYDWMMDGSVEVVGMSGTVSSGADDRTPNEFVFDQMVVDPAAPTIVD